MSENHESSQKLTIEQENAIDLLVQGLSDREVAEKVNVSRETVTRWRNENPHFQAELNRKRKEIWGAAQSRLRALVMDAVQTLENEVKEGNWRASVEVLKAVGLYGSDLQPFGLTDPEVIMMKEAETWAKKAIEKELPSEDPQERLLDQLTEESKKIALMQKRLEELKKQNND